MADSDLLNIVIVEETLNFKVVEFPTPTSYICSHALFITDVVPTSSTYGVVGFKEFEPDTVPPNIDLISAYTDTSFVTIKFIAEGGSSFYSPIVTIHGIVCSNLEEIPGDRRLFQGSVSIEVNDDITIVATSSVGGRDTVTLYVADAAPVPNQITVTYPGTQTALKDEDIVQVRVRTPNESVSVDLSSDAISSFSLIESADDSAGLGYKYFSGTAVINDVENGNYSVTAFARNLMGSVGRTFTQTNLLLVDQIVPSISSIYVNYPFSQGALKNGEWATISSYITNFDEVSYSSPHLTILYPTIYNLSKTVRSDYTLSYGSANYTIVARKLSNGSETIMEGLVYLSDEPPICTVTINSQRLNYDRNYEVLFYLDKPVQDASFYIETDIGILLPDFIKVNNSLYKSTLYIPANQHTDNVRFINYTSLGTSGLIGHQIVNSTYQLGGFLPREVVFGRFSRYQNMGVYITNISMVTASYLGSNSLTLRNNTDYYFDGFTIVDHNGNYDPFGDYIMLTDVDFCNSNTTGTLTVLVSEG